MLNAQPFESGVNIYIILSRVAGTAAHDRCAPGKEAQAAVGDDAELLDVGKRYLERQIVSLGGGSTEIARNVVAERVLNFPREYAADRGVPFSQVRRGARLMS